MSVERDGDLGARLEEALPAPSPGYGQKERVRRALRGRLSSSTRRAPALAIALALLVCATALVWVRVRSLAGAGGSGASVVSLARARVVVRAHGEIAVDHDDASGTVLRLVSGTILVHVRKGTGLPFTVLSGATRVEVVGTVFGVARLPANDAAVEVVEGVVRVTTASGSISVTVGEVWPAGSHAISATAAELSLLELPPLASSVTVRPVSASPSVVTSATPASPDAGARAEPRAREARPVAGMSKPDAYAIAKTLERGGDIDGALRAYAAIAGAHGVNAEDALFATVRLKAQRGLLADVVTAVAAYRAAFPEGRYARAVDVHAVNALLSLPDDAGVLREAEAFLRRFPEDPRAWRFHLARATSLARRGDCRGASADLARVPDSDAKRAVLEVCSGASQQ
jgi:hypothetical protein